MNNQHKQSNKGSDHGFTIIEVVLVLAIAGLIFLMVFIALPALQRGQRDAQRKQDLSRMTVQMTNYLSSTRGAVPSCDGDARGIGNFVKGYLKGSTDGTAGADYTDPNGNPYLVRCQKPTSVSQIGYYPKSYCDVNNADEGISTSNAARDYALTVTLENQSAPFCIDNKS